jgi:hypothetical protein
MTADEKVEALAGFKATAEAATKAELAAMAEEAGLDIALDGKVAEQRAQLVEAFEAKLDDEPLTDAPAEDDPEDEDESKASAEDEAPAADPSVDDSVEDKASADEKPTEYTGPKIEVLIKEGPSRKVLPEADAQTLIDEGKAVYIEHTGLPLS